MIPSLKNEFQAPASAFENWTLFTLCMNYKSGLGILIWPLEVPFFWSQRLALLAKVAIFRPKKKALRDAGA